MSNKTALIDNLGTLYRTHGGWRSLLQSAYFWLAVVFACLSWRFVWETPEAWTSNSVSIGPALTGFSIASFAVMFAIMDEKTRSLLLEKESEETSGSPLLELFAIVTHTIVVQVLSLIFAILFIAKPFPTIEHLEQLARFINVVAASVGVLLFYYGLTLVLSVALAIFKLFEIIADAQPVKKTSDSI